MEKCVSESLGLRPIEATGGKEKNFTCCFLFAVQLLGSKMIGAVIRFETLNSKMLWPFLRHHIVKNL
jgi:hypothetical protein